MCGIAGYVGKKPTSSILVELLKSMEYRGYDSAGIAVILDPKKPILKRSVWEVKNLEKKIPEPIDGILGIAHTRWATHGWVFEQNTHPHHCMKKRFFLAHNGIIENHESIREVLSKKGYSFYGDTDSETLVNLISYTFEKEGDLKKAIKQALSHVRGTYGIVIFDSENPDMLIVAKNGSPITLGIADDGYYVTSDVQAILPYTRHVLHLNDKEIAIITEGSHIIEHFDGKKIDRKTEKLEHELQTGTKGDYDHYMMKEIMEQPKVIQDTMRGRLDVKNNQIVLGGISEVIKELIFKKKVVIVACGTSYYAGQVGKYFLQEIAGIPTTVEIASEFRYQKNFWSEDMVVLGISQSGETADTLHALKEAKRRGIMTLGIVNVPGSAIANTTDAGVYTHAGAEIGVASTKAFTAQMTALFLLALAIGERKDLSIPEKEKYMKEFQKIPKHIKKIFSEEKKIKEVAYKLSDAGSVFFLGRYYQFPIAQEASLKFKEITYIHSEAYPAWELKHGPLALIDETRPTVVLAPKDFMYEKTMSAIHEVESRKGKVFTISDDKNADIIIPKTLPILFPFLSVISCQLLAYHSAVKLEREIDKPRNLAKSVTVE